VQKPLLVLEDTSATSRRALLRVAGVTWAVTRYAWVSPLSWGALGLVVAFAGRRGERMEDTLIAGCGYGLMLYASNVLHSLGHILAGRVAGAPVATILLTSTRDVTIYVQPGTSATRRLRATRAFGGPAANLLCGVAGLAVSGLTSSEWLAVFGYLNIGVALWTLTPVPSMDGWVIWRVLFGFDRGGAA
jgi:Zn-dependent protease